MPKIYGQEIFEQGQNAFHWYDDRLQNGPFPFMVLGNDFFYKVIRLNTKLICHGVPCAVASISRNKLCKPAVDTTGWNLHIKVCSKYKKLIYKLNQLLKSF